MNGLFFLKLASRCLDIYLSYHFIAHVIMTLSVPLETRSLLGGKRLFHFDDHVWYHDCRWIPLCVRRTHLLPTSCCHRDKADNRSVDFWIFVNVRGHSIPRNRLARSKHTHFLDCGTYHQTHTQPPAFENVHFPATFLTLLFFIQLYHFKISPSLNLLIQMSVLILKV